MLFEVKNYAMLQDALRALCDFLSENGIPSDSVFDSKLVACELLGNVLRHEGGNAKLSGVVKGEFIELKIISKSPFTVPQERPCAELLSEHGRGLFLVDSVCEQRIYSESDGIRVLIRTRK